MSRILFFLALFFSLNVLQAQPKDQLYPIRIGENWGYINAKGTLIIQPKYSDAGVFYDEYAIVQQGVKYGLMDKQEQWKIPPIYDSMERRGKTLLSIGLKPNPLSFSIDYGLCHIASEEVLIAPGTVGFYVFSDGRAAIDTLLADKSRRYGYINTRGRRITDLIWHTKYDYSEGRVLVKNDEHGYCFLDKHGKMAFTLEGEPLSDGFNEGLFPVKTETGVAFYNLEGKVVLSAPVDKVSSYYYLEEGLIRAKKGDKWGFIDLKGQWAIPPQFLEEGEFPPVSAFYEGRARVIRSGKSGFIDTEGNWVVEPTYEEVAFFKEGRAMVKQNGKWGVIDLDGKEIVPCQWDFIYAYRDGLAMVIQGDRRSFWWGIEGSKAGYIDLGGKLVWEPTE